MKYQIEVAITEKLRQEPKQNEARVQEVTRKVPADSIYMSFHMDEKMSHGYYVKDLLSDVLSRGQSARFNQELIKKKALW